MSMTKVQRKFKTTPTELRWVYINGDGKDTSEKKDGSKMQRIANAIYHKDSADLAKLREQLMQVWEEFKAANPSLIKKATDPATIGIKPIKDKETDEETDYVSVVFKTSSFFPDGKPSIVPVYNAKGEKVGENGVADQYIGNGSIGVLHGEAAGYEYMKKYGITLYLKGIQLAKFVPGSAGELSSDDLDCLEEYGDFEQVEGTMPEL